MENHFCGLNSTFQHKADKTFINFTLYNKNESTGIVSKKKHKNSKHLQCYSSSDRKLENIVANINTELKNLPIIFY